MGILKRRKELIHEGLRVFERNLFTEGPRAFLAAVTVVICLHILPCPRVHWHVPESHAVVTTDVHMAIAVGTLHILCLFVALQMEKTLLSIFCYFSADVFIGLKR